MGSKLIWIAAAIAFGAVSAAIYILCCWRSGRKNLLRRALISFAGYTLFALAVVYVLLTLLSV